jgi:hypothetical protein
MLFLLCLYCFFGSRCLVTDPNNVLFCSCYRLATVSHLTDGLQMPFSVVQYVRLLLAFASTVILDLSLLESNDRDFYFALDMYMFWNGASSSKKEGSVFLCRRYDCCTVVSARVYPRCHCVQVSMDSLHPLSLHCTK